MYHGHRRPPHPPLAARTARAAAGWVGLFLFVSAAFSLMPPPTTAPATAPSDDDWGPVSNGLRVRIEPVGDLTRKRAVVRCLIRNVSSASVTLVDAGVWPNHRLTLTRADGTAVPLTDAGRAAAAAFAPDGARRKAVAIELAAGATHTSAEIDLAALFELSPGEYRVEIAYEEGTIRVSHPGRSIGVAGD